MSCIAHRIQVIDSEMEGANCTDEPISYLLASARATYRDGMRAQSALISYVTYDLVYPCRHMRKDLSPFYATLLGST